MVSTTGVETLDIKVRPGQVSAGVATRVPNNDDQERIKRIDAIDSELLQG
jgi:hypothetical protein